MPTQAIDHRHVEIAVQSGIRRVVTIGAFHIHHIAVEARAKIMVELHLPFFAYAGEIEVYEVDHYTVHRLQWRFGIAFMHHALLVIVPCRQVIRMADLAAMVERALEHGALGILHGIVHHRLDARPQ